MTIIIMVFLLLYVPGGLDIFVLRSIFLLLIHIHVCVVSVLLAWIYMHVCININIFYMDLHVFVLFPQVLHGFICMFVWVSIVFTWIYIQVCVVSILVALIYMHVCMNIDNCYMDVYTYLCCFHTFCTDLHACVYEFQ